MATIILTPPRPVSPVDPELSVTDLHDDEPWQRNLPQLLIKLGQKLIENDLNEGWLSLSQVSAFCRRYRLRWQRGSTRAKELEFPISDYFETAGNLRANGVKVEAKTESAERRYPKLFLKFTKLNPDGTNCD